MVNPLTAIVIDVIKEKYITEHAFYTEKLNMNATVWAQWKQGEIVLNYDLMKVISTLFTDYEWMLVQKVVRNCETMPHLMLDPVKEYRFLKYEIAKNWMQHQRVKLEWHHTELNDALSSRLSNTVILKIALDYHIWGYSDVLELRLPSVIRQQIQTDQVKLLEWVDKQIQEKPI